MERAVASADSPHQGEGVPIGRIEDLRLLTGSGRFVADVRLAGRSHAAFVRSSHAHAHIRHVETGAARRLAGVLAVLTAADVAADGLGFIPWEVCPPLPPGMPKPAPGDAAIAPPQPLLAHGRVRFVGEPVAMVVAESADLAVEAAALVEIDYQPLDAVTSPAAALARAQAGDPIHPSFPDNVCFRHALGEAAATAAAFRRAAVVVELSAVNQRLAPAPIEPRGYVGSWSEADGRWTLHAAAGKPHPIRNTLARSVFKVPDDRIRVLVGDVGGGFGAKNILYAEAALVLWAARRLRRPVRWIAERTETFQSDTQGRDQTSDGAMAFDAEGRILAIRVGTRANIGAWLAPRAVVPVMTSLKILTSGYRIDSGFAETAAVFTNTVPTCPYRGAGAPEMAFLVERLIDLGATRLGFDAAEIRRRNLVPSASMPYRTVSGTTYDSGDFVGAVDHALLLGQASGFAGRRRLSEERGLRRGFGLAFGLEAFGTAINEAAQLHLLPDGGVEVLIGTQSSGQGHETIYATIAAEGLGIAAGRIVVRQGDTDLIARGNGTGASRSLTVGGSAVLQACRALIDLGRPVAGELLEAAAADLDYLGGIYSVVGTDRRVTLAEVARAAGGLAAGSVFSPTSFNVPYGVHIAEVEVDVETGQTRLDRYAMVQDSGRLINETVVAGQLVGGAVQGIGQALLEAARYDPDTGQLLSASFTDYALPRAGDLPSFAVAFQSLPTAGNPLGVKAVGEAGTVPSPPAVINAIVDALRPEGVTHVEMPATAEQVWRTIAAARQERLQSSMTKSKLSPAGA